jgi:ATP-dependent helicase HrpB
LGRLLLAAQGLGLGHLGAALAALIGERDLRGRGFAAGRTEEADAIVQLDLLDRAEAARFGPHLRDAGIEPQAAREVARVRDDLLRLLRVDGGPSGLPAAGVIPRLLLSAFPDRVVKRAAPDANRGMMVGGVAVELDDASAVAARRGQARGDLFLAVAIQGLGGGMNARTIVRQACDLTEDDLEAVAPGSVGKRIRLTWDEGRGVVEGTVGWGYRDLLLRVHKGAQADPSDVEALLAEHLTAEAEALLHRHEDAGPWLRRYRYLAQVAPDLGLPELDLAGTVRLACAGCRSRAEVLAKPLHTWLAGGLDTRLVQALDTLAPATFTVPSGSRMRLDYTDASPTQPPILAVRLQELFGCTTTPSIVDGRVPLLLHLQGPNYRTEQITRDLVGFWATTYPQVRKDLRGRYPKHSWPEDPTTAAAVCRGRPTKG